MAITVSVPGVNKILGTFVSCCKGPAVCILDKTTLEATFTPRNDGIVKACIAKTGECKKYQLGSNKFKKEDKWFNAVKCVFIVLEKDHPNLNGYDITIDGDVLECEGHIVFSSIAVATVRALNELMSLNLSNDQIAIIADSALRMFSESGNLADIYTMLNAKKGDFLIFNGLTREYIIANNPFVDSDYSLLLVDGHVPVSALRDEARSKEFEIYQAIKQYCEAYDVNCINFNSPEFLDRVYSFDEETKRLFKYMYEQHRAAINVVDILKKKDIPAFGKLLEKVRHSADEYLDLICPEMEWVIKRAIAQPGYLGSCLFYEGYSTKVAVVMKSDAVEGLKAYAEEYQHIFGFTMTGQVI